MSILSRESSTSSFLISNYNDDILEEPLNLVDIVLKNQNRAISHLASQYKNSDWSKLQLRKSLTIINNSLTSGGKLVVSGMGKSYKIANKVVATLNSLSVHSALLHPSEALHGDLGMIREEHNDSLLIISASGNSPELSTLLQHVPLSIPIVLLTCNKISPLAQNSQVKSLLYAELPNNLSEKNLYGLSAPTISTTLCLTLLDAVSIALAELQYKDLSIRQKRFGDRHPGGAIGLNYFKNSLDSSSSTRISSSSCSNDDNGLNSDFSSSLNLNYISNSVSETSSDICNDQDNTDSLLITKKINQSLNLNDESEGDITPIIIDNQYSTNKNKITTNDESDSDEILELKDIKLINLFKNSNSKINVDKLPETEFELLKLITIYEFLIINNLNYIDSKLIKKIYISLINENKSFDEIKLKINENLIKI
ncbi:transferase activity protein [[Candida] boidinii]|nr:transferase activity protein [[Candida] boidinii]